MNKKRSILIVDDDIRNIKIIQMILSRASIDVNLRGAESGDEAVEIVKEVMPDIVLLDIMMPGIDGYEVCRQIKSDKDAYLTKVILVSGKALVEERLMGYEAGADDYLTKPFDHDELVAKVKAFLKLVNIEKQLMDLNESLEEKVDQGVVQLAKSGSLNALGENVTGVARKLNEPLFRIGGYASILAGRYPEERSVSKILNSVEQLTELVKYIMLSGNADSTNDVIDINEVIVRELSLLQMSSASRGGIETSLDLGDISTITGSAVHFNFSLGNIMKTAVESMNESDRKKLSVSTLQEDDDIHIIIRDTGSGIPVAQIEDRLYEQLEEDRKKGMLSSKEMLESYGGEVSIQYQESIGTTCDIKIPVR